MIQAQGAQFAQMFDATKPIGIVVQSDGVLGAKVLGFIPTNNVQQLVGMLALFGMTAQPTDGGLLELQTGAAPVYIKEGQGWAFVSNNKESLANVPADPVPMLGGLKRNMMLLLKTWTLFLLSLCSWQ